MPGGNPWRRWFWGAGLVLAVMAGFLTRGQGDWWVVGPLMMVVVWGILGIVLELVVVTREQSSGPGEERSRDLGPADGEVGMLVMAATRSQANWKDARIMQFLGFDLYAGEPSRWPTPPLRQAFPRLRGRVAVISLFIGRDGKEWSDEEIAKTYRALRRAGEWIEREAIRWGAPVNVDLVDTYFVARDDRPNEEMPVPLGGTVSYIRYYEETEHDRYVYRERVDALARFSEAARRLGVEDAAELTAKVRARVAADHHVWLLHHRCSGTSMAIPGDLTELPGVTMAVCYARESEVVAPLGGPPFPDPVTFIHELLHLFGAMDRYDQPLSAFPAGSVTDRDVMLLEYESLSRLRVDLKTAMEIGWAGQGTRPVGEAAKRNRREPEDPGHGG